MTEVDDIKKLSPRERLERLKKLEENKKKELSEAERLIKESIQEIEDEQRITELTEHVEIPAPRRVNVDDLFESQEKDLEKKVEDAPLLEGEHKQYQVDQAAKSGTYAASGSYSIMQVMDRPPDQWVQTAEYELNRLRYADDWSAKDVQEFYAIEKNLEKVAGYNSLSSNVQSQVNLGRSIAENIRKYKQ